MLLTLAGHLQQCSRAFTKLESMDDKALPAAKRAEFADLAMDVFARYDRPSCATHTAPCAMRGTRTLARLPLVPFSKGVWVLFERVMAPRWA